MLIDQRALLRAVNNLVSNAERYAKTTLKVSFFKELEDYVLWVEDDGPGVPDAESETIFLAFKQLDNAQREISKEHGLGLAIVKQIAHWHNGSATVTRSQLGGAKFELKWPINRGESSA
jgi:two-component system sensor histidine kinase RstB